MLRTFELTQPCIFTVYPVYSVPIKPAILCSVPMKPATCADYTKPTDEKKALITGFKLGSLYNRSLAGDQWSELHILSYPVYMLLDCKYHIGLAPSVHVTHSTPINQGSVLIITVYFIAGNTVTLSKSSRALGLQTKKKPRRAKGE